MGSIDEEITRLEEEIRRTPYNKATQGHIGRLRAKIAALRLEKERRLRGPGGGPSGYAVRKSGHATVALVGYPSVGKSTLLTHLTGAESESAAYEFTTVSIIPGMLQWKGASIQILDMPGLVPGAARGRGRGREVLGVARSADLILFVLDPEHLEFRSLLGELDQAGIRVNRRPPKISISRRERGGLEVQSTVRLTQLSEADVRAIAREFSLHNGLIVFREDAGAEDLVDALAGNRVYVPALVVVNKADLMGEADRDRVRRELRAYEPVLVAAALDQGLTELKDRIARALAFIRIYLKPPGREPDLAEPLILRQGDTVAGLLDRLPREIALAFRAAQVWGPSARFPGQTVGRDHRLSDQDIVTVLTYRGSRGTS